MAAITNLCLFFFVVGTQTVYLIEENTLSLDTESSKDVSMICVHVTFLLLCFLQQVKKLQAILKPMMLRRLKDDVEKNLAPKEETIIEVGLCVCVCVCVCV